MAYESQTYEVILARMINRITSQYPNLDDREGSIIYNALAPAAAELAIAYIELDNVRNESFVDTATREYILKACEQMGIDTDQFDASAGTFKGKFNVAVELNSRWNCDLYNYTVTEFITHGTYYEYKLVCESTGTGANNVTGSLMPITSAPAGLNYAEITDCLIEGESEKTDAQIKTVYYSYLNEQARDGNVQQYKKWCDEYDGIGNYKIVPLWNGDNTVKVSILSASNRAASQTLIDAVQEYFDPLDEDDEPTGMGNGVAPIGAFVTVGTATELSINCTATITKQSGYDAETLKTAINNALTLYFAGIAYVKSVVSYMSVGAVILSVDGVESINSLTINGGSSDISLSTYQIPILGTTSWAVS